MARSLLAALLLASNRVVSLDRLETLLWDGRPPASSRASLHNHLMRLRRSLGEDSRVRSESGGLVLYVSEDELDATRLARYLGAARKASLGADWDGVVHATDAALALWRGVPLVEFPMLASDAAGQVAAWQEARLQLLELRGDAALYQGRYAELLPELHSLAMEFPLRESFHAQLIQVLHRIGRRAEALEVYHRLRRALVDTIGVEPGPAARSAYQEALEEDLPPPPTSTSALVPTIPLGVVPTSLPRDVASFTGRDDAVEGLLAGVYGAQPTVPGVVAIHAVNGMPGVGKTAFAVHIAHRLTTTFPDGQIFLPLHAHTPGTPPVDPGDALTSLLLAVGESPQRIPADLSARAGLWRSRLAGRRFLILLDDVRSSAQVEPLLPGTPGSLVLITSRQRLEALVDATPITLGVLTPAEAVRLLVAKAARADITHDDPAVPELAALCGYLPLAVQLVAARLRHRPAWTPAYMVDDLGAARGRLATLTSENASVSAAFELSYQDLPAERQVLFRRLGLLPGNDVDAYAVAALHDVPLDSARAMLEDLENRHLVEEQVRGRYRMHDLVREYARSLGAADGATETNAAVERTLDYYVHATIEACQHFVRYATPRIAHASERPLAMPVLGDAERSAAWMRAERANLLASVEYAAHHGYPAHAIRLPAAMQEFLRSQGHWNEALTLHQTALDAARATGDRAGQAEVHGNAAIIKALQGDFEQAESDSLTALDLFRDLQDRHGEGVTLHGLARIQRLTGRFDEAMRSELGALDCFADMGDRQGQAAVRVDMGHIQHNTGRYAQAIANLEQALELHRALEDHLGQANALTTLGDILKSTGRYSDSAARHRQALALYRRLGNLMGEASALTDLGDVLRLIGAYDEAADGIERALSLSREIGSRLGTAQALTYLGRVQLRRAQLEQAEENLQEAIGICTAVGSTFGRAYATMHLAEVQSALGAPSDAVHNALTSIDLCRELSERGGEATALNILGHIRMSERAPDQALRVYQEALTLARGLPSPYEEARALEGIGEALASLGQTDESTLSFRRALKIADRLRIPDADRLRAFLTAIPG
ncbi:tetratricopeptide repeat protein [Streptomyces sp. NPDC056883]|uniref:AfsR/SARP family transcriptional regulator n=1 Tax=Streptomyces sp. NPDC056883 TaxID=3345959 RepID=UPI0036B1457F